MASSLNIVVRRYDNITKSPNDNREYRGLQLCNGLKVLLISDPTADKSAAAMDVAAGHLMDPWEIPGTAHFCEHMLFLGTEKYPSENEYGKFITSHGGGTNAFTSSDHTNYHFDIKTSELYGGLDRFVQFFLSPQFTESATEREVCAVDSEHSNNLNVDSWRILQISRNQSKPGHDYGKFGTGNKQTLVEDARKQNIEPREALLNFHKKWYSSNIMSCAIIGKESLDTLESYLASLKFHEIENKDVEKKEWLEHPYGPEQLKKRVHIVPIKDTRLFKMVFPIPDYDKEYKSSPSNYITHLIGHESKGSILSELKRRGWASSLSSGRVELGRGMHVFNIMMDLSPDGLEHIEEIIELVLNYISLIKQEEPKQWIHDELKEICQTKFRFLDKQSPSTYATNLSVRLQDKPFEDILTYKYFRDEFKPDLIKDILNHLHPDNMMYYVVSKSFEGQEGNTNEPVYGTEMRLDDIPEDKLEGFRKALNAQNPVFHFPERNNYIATQFDLKPRDTVKSEHPRIVYDDQWTRVWHKQDDEYQVPKLITRFFITSPAVSSCPKTATLSTMFFYCLNDALVEENYNAGLAGMDCAIYVTTTDTQIAFGGYDEKQSVFIEHLFKVLVNFKPDPVRFNVLLETLKRSYQNNVHSQPYQNIQQYTTMVLSEKYWTDEQCLSVVDSITLEDVEQVAKNYFKAFHLEVYSHGNCTEEESIAMAQRVTSILKDSTKSRPLFKNEMLPIREYMLENEHDYIYRSYQKTHDVSCVNAVFQIGLQNTRDDTITKLFSHLIREPAFVQLRTNEQLGYVVSTSHRAEGGTMGLKMLVQGPKEPTYVLERIESFLEGTRQTLIDMPEKDFNENVDGLIASLSVKPKTLNSRAMHFMTEMFLKLYDFDRKNKEIEVLRTLTKDDVIAFYDKKIAKGAPERKKLSIVIYSKSDNAEDVKDRVKRENSSNAEIEIEDVEEFKMSMPLYGRPKLALPIPHVGKNPLEIIES
ncbi:unnamed protein product [Auanema sp. JU1783]|nr:unnamed protein product [Auanema sp. JU1783]